MTILIQDIATARNPFLTFEESIKEQRMHQMQENPLWSVGSYATWPKLDRNSMIFDRFVIEISVTYS